MNDLSPFQWALRPLKNYGDFAGRSPRQEYWWWFLFQLLLIWMPAMVLFFAGVFSSIGASQGTGAPPEPSAGFWVGFAIFALVVLGLILPNLAVQVRRMHDQNLSGWLVLIFFIPYIGGIIAIVFMCLPGTKGPNRFGRDPYEVENGYLEQVFT